MRAVRVHGLRDIRIDEVPEPGAPGPSEILVAPRWGGLCGTDVKEYVGPVGSVPDQPHPLTGACVSLIRGREFSGSVVAVGSAIADVRPGDRVAVMPLHYCGACPLCLRGDFILCPQKAWLGISDRWGGFGDLAMVQSYQVTRLGSLTDEQGAVVEPAAVSLNAVLRGGVAPGRYRPDRRLRADRFAGHPGVAGGRGGPDLRGRAESQAGGDRPPAG